MNDQSILLIRNIFVLGFAVSLFVAALAIVLTIRSRRAAKARKGKEQP